MRYQCKICDKWVKDKFIFGLLHLCMSNEEILERAKTEQRYRNLVYPYHPHH